MYIKQVIISGFRSFKSQSEMEPFSPQHNVVVGRNGSGKSNFFDAIQFALLSQRFVSLRPEERQHLLHEGAGANVINAFVEIVFDNSDGRMAQDGDEVVLRRAIGLKKDEFFLNRKKVNKSEVTSLLESAGFSSSNPYYIVQQGKVSALTLMKDEERLNLLREIAGTKVYEERREESRHIMEETNSKRDKIQEVIDYIEERLAQLEGEKEELGAYQKLDRSRRALEYTLYNKEFNKARADLEEIEKSRAEDADRTQDLHESLRKVTDRIKAQETALATAAGKVARLEQHREAAEEERRETLASRTKIELEVKDNQERVAADQDAQSALKTELSKLEKTLAARETELRNTVEPNYFAAQDAVRATETELAEATAQADELYAKQGRQGQFADAEERDAFLRSQVAVLESTAAEKRGAAAATRDEIHKLEERISSQKKEIVQLESDVKARHEAVAKITQDIARKTGDRDAAAEERKDRWRDLEALQDRHAELVTDLRKAERNLRSAMPRAAAQGLEALERIVEKEKIQGYLGPVIDNFTLEDDNFATAVEVAAGNSLFHVIVDTDDTAAKLMQRLEKGRLGRVTFMPLSRLRPKNPTYPDAEEVTPLLEKAIRHEPNVLKAMQQVFGRKLLAKDSDAALRFSASADMDAITMEGDEVGRKGALRGGYYDEGANRILASERLRKYQRELQQLGAQQRELKVKAAQADQAVTGLLGELEKLDARRASMRNVNEQCSVDLTALKQAVKAAEIALASKKESLPLLESDAKQSESRASALKQEMGTPLHVSLSQGERQRLAELNGKVIPKLRRDLQARIAAFEAASAERQRLKSLLTDHLLKRKDDLVAHLDPEHGGVGSSHVMAERQGRQEVLTARVQELERLTRQLEDNRKRLGMLEKEILEHKQDMRELSDQIEQLRGHEDKDGDRLSEASKMAERLLNKRALLLQKREDNTRKLQELGSLPGAELEQYKNLGIKQLMKKLGEVNDQLKKYSHVNKKALDQYVNFSEQRETLLARKKELDEGAGAIEELIDALDQQKDEAILRTFKGVSQHFKEVFKELVPSGSGQLVMKTRADPNAARGGAAEENDEEAESEAGVEEQKSGGAASDDEDGENRDPQKKRSSKGKGKAKASSKGKGKAKATNGEPSPSEFTGVQVRVSFSGHGEVFLMSQLSGGQKALVALALIFAIQRCDPAPFYLFDEIDQALDSNYRAAVASLIQRQAHASEPTQFVTTTFRPEMVQAADRCYGISLQNKVSNIHELSRDEALAFVRSIMSEEAGEGVIQPTRNSTQTSGGGATSGSSSVARGGSRLSAAGSSFSASESTPKPTPTRASARAVPAAAAAAASSDYAGSEAADEPAQGAEMMEVEQGGEEESVASASDAEMATPVPASGKRRRAAA